MHIVIFWKTKSVFIKALIMKKLKTVYYWLFYSRLFWLGVLVTVKQWQIRRWRKDIKNLKVNKILFCIAVRVQMLMWMLVDTTDKKVKTQLEKINKNIVFVESLWALNDCYLKINLTLKYISHNVMYNIIKILEKDWTAASGAWTCGDQAAKELYSPICLLFWTSQPTPAFLKCLSWTNCHWLSHHSLFCPQQKQEDILWH